MKVAIALEWFLNPDHLPLLAAIELGFFAQRGLEVEIIEPDEHYDGFEALKKGEIAFAINEPLHLIEQFDEKMLDLGTFFETRGGVMLTREGETKLLSGQPIRISTPVENPKTDAIAKEILRRYGQTKGVHVDIDTITFDKTDFYHIRHIKEGYDGGWLVFYNFEGVEAKHEKLDVVLIEAANASYPNFSALDLFTTKSFYNDHPDVVKAVIEGIEEAIANLRAHPHHAREIYYRTTNESPSPLVDEIIQETLGCFVTPIRSRAQAHRPILSFFKEIGISDLDEGLFAGAFLG
ncbi:MAG: ABC transporter substrate-binding protein [Campylobacterales bacterium]